MTEGASGRSGSEIENAATTNQKPWNDDSNFILSRARKATLFPWDFMQVQCSYSESWWTVALCTRRQVSFSKKAWTSTTLLSLEWKQSKPLIPQPGSSSLGSHHPNPGSDSVKKDRGCELREKLHWRMIAAITLLQSASSSLNWSLLPIFLVGCGPWIISLPSVKVPVLLKPWHWSVMLLGTLHHRLEYIFRSKFRAYQ